MKNLVYHRRQFTRLLRVELTNCLDCHWRFCKAISLFLWYSNNGHDEAIERHNGHLRRYKRELEPSYVAKYYIYTNKPKISFYQRQHSSLGSIYRWAGSGGSNRRSFTPLSMQQTHKSCVHESLLSPFLSTELNDMLCSCTFHSCFWDFISLDIVLRTLNGISVHIALPCVMMGSMSGSFPSQQSSSTHRHPASRTCIISRTILLQVLHQMLYDWALIN